MALTPLVVLASEPSGNLDTTPDRVHSIAGGEIKGWVVMRRREPLRQAVPVSIEIEKKKYIGEYYVEHGLMTVWYGSRRRVVRRKLSDPCELTLARILLLDMVEADLAARGS